MTEPTKVEGHISLQSLEDVVGQSSQGCVGDLSMSLHPQVSSIGVEAAAAQMAITWAKYNPSSQLRLPLSQELATATDQTERFVKKHPIGLVACSMLSVSEDQHPKISLIADRAIEEQLHSYRTAPQEQQLSLFAREDSDWSTKSIPSMGQKLFLPCVDHLEFGKIPHMYNSDSKMRSESEFRALIDRLLRKILTSSAFSSDTVNPFSPDLVSGISRIVFELFDNTDRWATRDANGENLPKSSRGILLRLHNASGTSFRKSIANVLPLNQYFSRPELLSDSLRMIEISIYDSGPGLAARYLKCELTDNDTIEIEFQAVCDCFGKGRSTSRQSGRGFGLYYLMKTLTDLKGFVRLRSGRLSLYRDLIEKGTRENKVKEGWFGNNFSDWYGNTGDPTKLPPVQGAVFTILVPVI